ncbi:MAG: hypothetical protein LAO07_17835 [Acidobacteriia bacterium]|nr:hypothetical protein [Terriglobia bacterium]
MESSVDVRKVAYDLLDTCKAFLQEKGYLPPYGVVLDPAGRVSPVALHFSDKEAKKRSMQKLGQLAHDKKAVAVITIFDATYRIFPQERDEASLRGEDPEFPGAFEADGRRKNCVCMEIKVQGETPTIVMIPYWKDGLGNIVLGSPEEAPLDHMGPDLPDTAEDPLTKD